MSAADIFKTKLLGLFSFVVMVGGLIAAFVNANPYWFLAAAGGFLLWLYSDSKAEDIKHN